MENLTIMEIYTSPSGIRYEIRHNDKAGFDQWDIYQEDRWVQFALSEAGIAGSVAHYENPGSDLGSRFD